MTHPSISHRTAVVFGGGGSTGNAWLIGVAAGLLAAGLDISRADLTVGTSSGATAAAQLSAASAADVFAQTLAAVSPPRPHGAASPVPSARPLSDHLERMRAIIASSEDAADYRRRMGLAAVGRDAVGDGSRHAQWRAVVTGRLPGVEWPERPLQITAVEAGTGQQVAFDRNSGVDLVDAVAASTSGGGSAYPIGERHYIDGGYRTNADNADLAAGFERVLILAPLGGRALTPATWGTHLVTQIDDLRAGGSSVEVIMPVDADLFGADAMNHALRPTAAQTGFDQGRAEGKRLATIWR